MRSCWCRTTWLVQYYVESPWLICHLCGIYGWCAKSLDTSVIRNLMAGMMCYVVSCKQPRKLIYMS